MLPNLFFFLYIQYIITSDQATVVTRQSRVATGLAEKKFPDCQHKLQSLSRYRHWWFFAIYSKPHRNHIIQVEAEAELRGWQGFRGWARIRDGATRKQPIIPGNQGWGQFRNWNWNWYLFQFRELELKRNWIKGIGIDTKELIQFLFLIVNSFWFFCYVFQDFNWIT